MDCTRSVEGSGKKCVSELEKQNLLVEAPFFCACEYRWGQLLIPYAEYYCGVICGVMDTSHCYSCYIFKLICVITQENKGYPFYHDFQMSTKCKLVVEEGQGFKDV